MLGCGAIAAARCTPGVSGTLHPGFRNEFHAGLQQAVGKNVVFSGEYIWKYTHNAFDFSVLGNTPITFPIDWHNSKIPGYALHVDVPNFHDFSAYLVTSSVAARFFPPQVAGAGATVGQTGLPFRIDHDEKFNQTTHLQYTVSRDGSWVNGLWGGFNWRYDSGLVAGSTPCYGVDRSQHALRNSTLPPDGAPGSRWSTPTCAYQNPVTGAGPSVDRRRGVSGWLHLQWREGHAHSGPPRRLPGHEFTSSLIKFPRPTPTTTTTTRSASRRAACSM